MIGGGTLGALVKIACSMGYSVLSKDEFSVGSLE